MHSNELLAVIKADRERDLRAAQRVRLLDRSKVDETPDQAPTRNADRVFGRIVGRSAQSGRTTADPSL